MPFITATTVAARGQFDHHDDKTGVTLASRSEVSPTEAVGENDGQTGHDYIDDGQTVLS